MYVRVLLLQANLDEQQTSSNVFARALMTCICQSAVICESAHYLLKPSYNQDETSSNHCVC